MRELGNVTNVSTVKLLKGANLYLRKSVMKSPPHWISRVAFGLFASVLGDLGLALSYGLSPADYIATASPHSVK